MSAWNVGYAIGDNLAAYFVGHFSISLPHLFIVNGFLTGLMIMLIPLLPKPVLIHREATLT
jgi:MFS family permease